MYYDDPEHNILHGVFVLSLNGKDSIFSNVLTNSSYLLAALYFVGLIGALAMGYAITYLVYSKGKSTEKSGQQEKE